jgi:hypothetical protein
VALHIVQLGTLGPTPLLIHTLLYGTGNVHLLTEEGPQRVPLFAYSASFLAGVPAWMPFCAAPKFLPLYFNISRLLLD